MTSIIRELLAAFQHGLAIEPEWLDSNDGGFRWWPGPLAQRLWVEEDAPHARLHIETDLLRDVSCTDRHLAMVSHGNMLATFSALVLSPSDRRLRLHASVCLPSDGASEAIQLASVVAAMQAADADAKANGLAAFFDAEVDVSSHPASGRRTLGHAALRTLELMRAENETREGLATLDFTPLQNWKPRPWLMATADIGGMTAEFPCLSDEPALLAAVRDDAQLGSALLQLTTDEDHPQLKHGLLARLTLPVDGSPELANALNLLEAYASPVTRAHQLGAWCCRGTQLAFVSFTPSVLFSPNVLVDLLGDTAYRARWAGHLLAEGSGQ